jgi:peptide chain release factor 1
VRLRDVVDQLHDQHRLADARAAEQADLAALRVGREQIDDLDAGGEDLGLGRLVDEQRCRLVDGRGALGADRAALVDRLADHVEDAPERLRADGHDDRLARVEHLGAAHQAVSGIHGDRAHGALAQMLRNLEDEAVALVVHLERVQDAGQMLAVEMHVDHGPEHLAHMAGRDILPVGGFRHRLRTPSTWSAFQRFGAGDDLDQLFGDLRLPRAVVAQAQRADHFARVARRAVHRGHACALLAG